MAEQNTPKVGQQFRAAAESRARSNEKTQPKPDIATAAEVKKLQGERQKPTPAPQLKPSGVQARAVDQRINQQREARINQVQNRLNNAQDRFERNFDRKR